MAAIGVGVAMFEGKGEIPGIAVFFALLAFYTIRRLK